MWSTIVTICLCFIKYSSSYQAAGIVFGLQRFCLCRCGMSMAHRDTLGQVMSGERVTPHEFPWLAAVNVGSLYIPGSLISDRHVLTAASPLYRVFAANVSVTLGAHDRCKVSALNISVDYIILHNDYSPLYKLNNIALVKLQHPVAFSDKIAPICMSFFGGRRLERSVWVATWTHNTSVCTPRIVALPSTPEVTCYNSYPGKNVVTPDKGCLGLVHTKSVICKEDVGAPVMTRWTSASSYRLLGVVSTSSCDLETSPLYTRVIDHAAWVYEHIRYDCRCF